MKDYAIKTPSQLGSVLRGYRVEQKLTQEVVGRNSGLAQNAISLIESNPGPASLERIFKVLAALDLELVVRSRKPVGPKAEW